MVSSFEQSVSVITPAYNCCDTIRRCVESVAAQSFPVLEQVIVDDGSTDGTGAELALLEKEYSFVKVVHQKNRGAGAARNSAIELAKGRFIAFLDADDFWLQDKVLKQVNFMERTQCAFSYGEYYIVRGDDVTSRDNVYRPPEMASYKELLTSCPIGCLTAMYDQYTLGKVKMPTLKRGQDWALWLKLTRGGLVAYKYPGVEAVYYVQPNSLSNNKLKKFFDVFKVYHESENMGFIHSLYLTVVHSVKVVLVRKRGV